MCALVPSRSFVLSPDTGAAWSKPALALGRWSFRPSNGRTVSRLDEATYRRAADLQRREPFLIGRQRGRQWWWYQDRFYCDDSGLLSIDVRAIVSGRAD